MNEEFIAMTRLTAFIKKWNAQELRGAHGAKMSFRFLPRFSVENKKSAPRNAQEKRAGFCSCATFSARAAAVSILEKAYEKYPKKIRTFSEKNDQLCTGATSWIEHN